MDDLEPTAAIYVSVSGGIRTVGVAVLAERARTATTDPKTRSLKLYNFIDDDQGTHLGAVLASCQVTQTYIAETGLAADDMNRLMALCTEEEEEQDGEYARKAAKIARSRFADADAESLLVKLHGGPVAGLDSAPIGVKAAAGLSAMCQLSKLATSADVAAASSSSSEGGGAAGGGSSSSSSSSSSSGGGGSGSLPATGAPGTYDVAVASLDKYMRLDNAAIRALSLLPSRRDAVPAGGGGAGSGSASAASAAPAAASVTSVFGMFARHLRTPAGRRTLKSWLLQPLRDVEEIVWRQDRVAAFVESVALRQGWKAWGFDDVSPLLARLGRPRAGLSELVKLRQVMDSLPAAVALLEAHGGGGGGGGGGGSDDADDGGGDGGALGPFSDSLRQLVAMCTPWLDEYKRTVDDRDPRRPRLRAAMDEGLSELQERVEGCKEGIGALKAKYEATWPSEVVGGGLELLNDRAKGWVFRVKKSAEKALRGIFPGVNMVAVLKDGIYFNTPKLATAAEELGEAEDAYGERSRELIGPLLASAVGVAPVLESAQVLVGELDCYCAMAEVATSSPNCDWTRPTMTGGGGGAAGGAVDAEAAIGDVLIVNGRHPVVNHQEENYIANDYTMRRTAGRFQIVTGPNAGGKSVYIRAIGVLAVLAQIGSYVPADSATLPVFDCVAARIGAGDKSVKGLSTFMAEMLEASAILAGTTSRSLVIIDELGRGTSTYDGFGLAWAISEHLIATTRCFALFATHFHELTALAHTTPLAANRHVSVMRNAGSGELVMLFRVREGPCPSSFGIQAAQGQHFPPSVVEAARAKAAQLEALGGGATGIMMSSSSSSAAAAAAAGGVGGAGSEAAAGADGGGAQQPLGAAPADDAEVERATRFLTALAAEAGFEALQPEAKRARLSQLLEA